MEVFGRVYGIECLINHKIYVGKTIQPLEKRIQGHKWGKKSLISRAMRKYGFENFVYIVIEECETPEKLNEREIYWIAKLNCKNPNGYNMTDGGEGCLGFHHSEETKKYCLWQKWEITIHWVINIRLKQELNVLNKI